MKTTVIYAVMATFFLSGCAMLIRESHVDDKTYRKFSALAQQQLPTTKHPLIGIYVLELEADQETIKPEDGRKPLYEGVKIAAVRNDSKIEFVSLSSLKIDSYDLIPDQDAFLQGITLWEVPISPFMHTNTWKGIATGIWGGMHENSLFIASESPHSGPITVEILDEQWLRIVAPGKSYFLKKIVSDLSRLP